MVAASDDLKAIFGDDLEQATQLVPAGTVQYECPMHIHRAPEPHKERRVIFVAWDYHRLVNASTTTVFADTWEQLWFEKDALEADKKSSRKPRAKKRKVEDIN